ncbi:hypothetical protein [Nocardioides ultimimeridianus]
MILLLALPVIAMVTLTHRYLLLYAPSNVLIRRVRASRPTLSRVTAMLAVATVLIIAVKALSDAVVAGAPGWLNLLVLVLAWDAIKVGLAAGRTTFRYAWCSARRVASRTRARAKVASACRVA